ncbi:MAG: hypothetical protein WD845_01450 [Pirellulales bacterium]
MEPIEILNLVSRWLHILAAITAVGGTIFARFVVVPSLEPLPLEQRAALHAAMRVRWSKIVAVAIGFLLLSGLYTIGYLSVEYRLPKWYHPVFGVKFLLAFVIFAVASLLTGKTPAADNVRRHLRFWLNLNIVLAVLVVCLSGILRTAERIPKRAAEAAAQPNSLESPPKPTD